MNEEKRDYVAETITVFGVAMVGCFIILASLFGPIILMGYVLGASFEGFALAWVFIWFFGVMFFMGHEFLSDGKTLVRFIALFEEDSDES